MPDLAVGGKLELFSDVDADGRWRHRPRTILVDSQQLESGNIYRRFPHEVDQLPAAVAASIDLWSICCPTYEHLPVLQAVLARNPAARIMLEKPACQGHEINEFTELLARHPQARVVVNDHYRHATTLPAFTELISQLEPDTPLSQVRVTFTKDRAGDIAHGRFVDRAYGVLGYEWLHMLAVLSRVLPNSAFEPYMRSEPNAAELWATYDPRLFVAALTERTILPIEQTGRIFVELASSILGPHILVGATPTRDEPWRRDIRAADDRHRHIVVSAAHRRASHNHGAPGRHCAPATGSGTPASALPRWPISYARRGLRKHLVRRRKLHKLPGPTGKCDALRDHGLNGARSSVSLSVM